MTTSSRPAFVAGAPFARPVAGPGIRAGRNLPAYIAIGIGIGIRAALILPADFPLNDGGLFYVMSQEVQAAHFRLPAFTTYNDAQIPFAYSPAAFYLAAAINSLTGISYFDLLRFLPLVATSLLVVAFYHLAKAMLGERFTVAAAVLAFAIVPRSYALLLMGGGLTRSIGLLAAVVALHQAFLLYTRRDWRYAAGTAAACALTVLSHIATAPFLVWSIALLFVFYGRHRHGVLASIVVAAATIGLTAPWWSAVIAQHGLAPFLAAQNSAGTPFKDIGTLYTIALRFLRFNMFTGGEALFPIYGFFAVLGAFASLRPGRVIFVVWWALTIVTDVRSGETFASIPGSMLAGIGIVVFASLLRSLYADTPLSPTHGGAMPPPLRSPSAAATHLVPTLVLAFLMVFGVSAALSRSPDYGDGLGRYLTALQPQERDLMGRLSRETPPSSRFIVVTGQPWWVDKLGEWFPVLANRAAVNVVQGTEWIPGEFAKRVGENADIQSRCANADGACLAGWARATSHPFTHVYVGKSRLMPCCDRLMDALRHDPDYMVLYDGPAALVAERRLTTTATR